jgi:hypothetical protein
MAIISKYLFDGTFQDSVGSVHGTANGGMDASATDGERTVVVFDGTDDYIDFGSDFRFNTEDFSFSMWIKPQSSQGEWARIMGTLYNDPIRGWALEQEAAQTNRYRFQSFDGNTWTESDPNNVIDITPDVWSHLVITRSGTAIKGYINGQHVYTAVTHATMVSTHNFQLGTNPAVSENNWGDYWGGSIDEFTVHDTALTDVEVENLYAESVTLEDALVAKWALNTDGSDSIGSADGTVSGVSFIDGHATFDGASHISLPHDDGHGFGGDTVSVSAWVKTTSTENDVIWLKAYGAGGGDSLFELAINHSGDANKARLFWRNSAAGGSGICISTSDINDGAWHHIVGVRSGSDLHLYVDGVLESSASGLSGNFTGNLFYLGKWDHDSYAAQKFYTGNMDDMRIWSRELSATEVTELYTAGVEAAPVTLTMSLTKSDSWGDGWNGTMFKVYDSNGAEVASHTLAAGHGPEVSQFSLQSGDYTWALTNQNYPNEISLTLVLDSTSASLATVSAGNITSGAFTIESPEPSITATLAGLSNMDITVSAAINQLATDAGAANWSASLSDFGEVSATIDGSKPITSLEADATLTAPGEGTHDVYVAVIDGAGVILAKSSLSVEVLGLSSGLVAHYELLSDTGDSVGAFAGTNQGITFDLDADHGRDVGIFAANAYASLPANLNIGNGGAYTVSTMINPDALGTTQQILTDHLTMVDYPSFVVGMTQDGRIYVTHRNANANGNQTHTSTASLSAATWTHLGLTFDGSTIKIYFDGVEDSSAAMTYIPWDSSREMRLGNDTAAGLAFSGKMFDVKVYTRALNSIEMPSLYQASLSAAIGLTLTSSDGDITITADPNQLAVNAGATQWAYSLAPLGAVGQAHNGTAVDIGTSATISPGAHDDYTVYVAAIDASGLVIADASDTINTTPVIDLKFTWYANHWSGFNSRTIEILDLADNVIHSVSPPNAGNGSESITVPQGTYKWQIVAYRNDYKDIENWNQAIFNVFEVDQNNVETLILKKGFDLDGNPGPFVQMDNPGSSGTVLQGPHLIELPVTLETGLKAEFKLDSDLNDNIGALTLTQFNGATLATSEGRDGVSLPNTNSGLYPSTPIELSDYYTISLMFKDLKDINSAQDNWLMFDGYSNAGTNGSFGGDTAGYIASIYTNQELGAWDTGWNSSGFQMTQANYSGDGWHHLAAVYNAGTVTYYVDGQQAGNPVAYSGRPNIQAIGSWANYDYAPADYIDQVLIYDRALSENQIVEIYNNDGATQAPAGDPAPQGGVTMTKYINRVHLESQLNDIQGGDDMLGGLNTVFVRRDGKSIIPDGLLDQSLINYGQVSTEKAALEALKDAEVAQHTAELAADDSTFGTDLTTYQADRDQAFLDVEAGYRWKASEANMADVLLRAIREGWANATVCFAQQEAAIMMISDAAQLANFPFGLEAGDVAFTDNGDGTITISGGINEADQTLAADATIPFMIKFEDFETQKAQYDAQRTSMMVSVDDFYSVTIPGAEANREATAASFLADIDSKVQGLSTSLDAMLTLDRSAQLSIETTYDQLNGSPVDFGSVINMETVEIYINGLRCDATLGGGFADAAPILDGDSSPTGITISAGLEIPTGHQIHVKARKAELSTYDVA